MGNETIRSVEEFLAHALAIEREAVNNYRKFAACFSDRGDDVLAGLCANLAAMEQGHHEELQAAAEGRTLPEVVPGKYKWLDGNAPESPPHEAVFRLATPAQVLGIALAGEQSAAAFFDWVAKTSPDATVARMATEMALEEAEHIRWIGKALEYLPAEVDWERVLAAGGGPGLALGEERRLHRGPTLPPVK